MDKTPNGRAERHRYCFEVCAAGIDSCRAAERAGADRVELCSGMVEGGITPSHGVIKVAREVLSLCRLHVIIRPRGGDFIYSDDELRAMTEDILSARDMGVDGVVFGCLDERGDVDERACAALLRAADGMSTTFHRAFDCCAHPLRNLERLVRLGFDRLLTSGQEPTAELGVPLLRSLHAAAAGRIVIMAGSGVNERNIARIHAATGIGEFHFSARSERPGASAFRNPRVTMGASDGTIVASSYERIVATIRACVEGDSIAREE